MKTLTGIIKIIRMAMMVGLSVIATERCASAADVTFQCAAALQSAMQELIPEFQKASGHNVKIEYANLGMITERIQRGDQADLAIVSPKQWESLQKDGKVSAETRIVIAKVGLGVFVAKGSNHPDIGSVDAFKHALLNARSIAVANPNQGSPEGAYLIPLFDRLGIGSDIKSKLKITAARHGATIEAVVKGDADIGFTQLHEIVVSPDVDLVGPLPADIQNFTIFTAAVPASAKQVQAAKALAIFLASQRAILVFKSKGLQAG